MNSRTRMFQALRFLADETDEELLEHLRRHETGVVWETTERIMVGITAAPGNDALLRRAARIASRVKAEIDVVHVVASEGSTTKERQAIDELRRLATDVGARWYDLQDEDAPRAIARFASQHQITQIVIGSSQRSRWRQVTGGGSKLMGVIREAGNVGIDVHVIARREVPAGEKHTTALAFADDASAE